MSFSESDQCHLISWLLKCRIQPNLTIIHSSNRPYTFLPLYHFPHYLECHTPPLQCPLLQLPSFEIVFIHWRLAQTHHLLDKNFSAKIKFFLSTTTTTIALMYYLL